jgi:hypothetical protein
MKPKLAKALLFIFCFAELGNVLPILEYKMNYEYISQVLCINKSQLSSSCKGKCYLNKQLKKSQESQKKVFIDFNERVLIVNRTPAFFNFLQQDSFLKACFY